MKVYLDKESFDGEYAKYYPIVKKAIDTFNKEVLVKQLGIRSRSLRLTDRKRKADFLIECVSDARLTERMKHILSSNSNEKMIEVHKKRLSLYLTSLEATFSGGGEYVIPEDFLTEWVCKYIAYMLGVPFRFTDSDRYGEKSFQPYFGLMLSPWCRFNRLSGNTYRLLPHEQAILADNIRKYG